MRERRGRLSCILLWPMLLLGVVLLAGCAFLEDMNDTDYELTDTLGELVCEPHETEVEPGICSYTVDCDDADTCEAWSAMMVSELEQWFGDLLYAEEWEVSEKDSEKEPDQLAAYRVKGNQIGLANAHEDEDYHTWLWNRFIWIIPSEHRQMISQFEVYDHADMMAFVVQDEDDYESWIYGANQIQATYETERVMTDIHEFGHLLSLNAEQLDLYADESACDTYMLDEGCAYEDSYIYDFYLSFWEDGGSEYEDDYVNEYAMTSIYEDFAESWAYFVMAPRPGGSSLPDQKISFFYNYEELVMLKAQILGRAASYLDRNVEYEQ